MALEEYRKKRRFDKTPEPAGELKTTGKSIFVVHEHHAKNLHWDLRLEKDGVLKSWAVPKGLPTEPKVKRLAIPTEDHPVGYANFEGEIPEGEYGAGTVKIWDNGTFEEIIWRDNKIEVNFKGKRLKGVYFMITTKMGWLIFKKE